MTEKHCVAIVAKIVEICNNGGSIKFERDWDDFCVTIIVEDEKEGSSHTHCSNNIGKKLKTENARKKAFERLAEDINNTLNHGTGLSWYNDK